jgi:hypothetical protein
MTFCSEFGPRNQLGFCSIIAESPDRWLRDRSGRADSAGKLEYPGRSGTGARISQAFGLVRFFTPPRKPKTVAACRAFSARNGSVQQSAADAHTPTRPHASPQSFSSSSFSIWRLSTRINLPFPAICNSSAGVPSTSISTWKILASPQP